MLIKINTNIFVKNAILHSNKKTFYQSYNYKKTHRINLEQLFN